MGIVPGLVALFAGVLAVVAAIPRKLGRSDDKYSAKSGAVIFGSLAVFVVLNAFTMIGFWPSLTFWVLWGSAALVYPIRAATKGVDSFGAVIGLISTGLVVAILAAMGFFGWFGANGPEAPAKGQEVISVDRGNGQTQTLPHVGDKPDATADKPLAGADAVNDTTAPPTLKDGKGPVTSWTNLVERVEALPKDQRDAYIKAINARSKFLGTWEDVKRYAALEKEQKGLDTRVILILNSDVTDQQARDALRKKMGDVVDHLPIVRASGDLINTRGVETGKIEDFGDGRSQIRVILTVPLWDAKEKKYVANLEAAKKGTGILVECTNPATGIVPKPHVIIVPPKKTPPPPGKTPPATTHTTPPPTSTTTPPPTSTTTPPPTTTTPPPPTETTTPPPTTTTPPPPTTTPPPEETPTKGPVPHESGKPTVGPPSGQPESSAPVESHPADPTTKPGDEVTSVPAPGATQEPSSDPKPDPVGTQAPTDGTTIPDPDATTSPAITPTAMEVQQGNGSIAVAALLGAIFLVPLAGVRRRRGQHQR